MVLCAFHDPGGGGIYFDGDFWKLAGDGNGKTETGWNFSQQGVASVLPLGTWTQGKAIPGETHRDYKEADLKLIAANEPPGDAHKASGVQPHSDPICGSNRRCPAWWCFYATSFWWVHQSTPTSGAFTPRAAPGVAQLQMLIDTESSINWTPDSVGSLEVTLNSEQYAQLLQDWKAEHASEAEDVELVLVEFPLLGMQHSSGHITTSPSPGDEGQSGAPPAWSYYL